MLNQSIVAFVDVLGYKEIVNQRINDEDFIKRFEDVIFKLTVDLFDSFCKMSSFAEDTNLEDYFHEIVKNIRIRFIYDNIMISLTIPHDRDSSYISHSVETFFGLLSLILLHIDSNFWSYF